MLNHVVQIDMTDMAQGARDLRAAYEAFEASDALALHLQLRNKPGSDVLVGRTYSRAQMPALARWVAGHEAQAGIAPPAASNGAGGGQAQETEVHPSISALASYRARARAIIEAGHAGRRFVQAVSLALDTDLGTSDALATLSAMPTDAAAGVSVGATLFPEGARAAIKNAVTAAVIGGERGRLSAIFKAGACQGREGHAVRLAFGEGLPDAGTALAVLSSLPAKAPFMSMAEASEGFAEFGADSCEADYQPEDPAKAQADAAWISAMSRNGLKVDPKASAKAKGPTSLSADELAKLRAEEAARSDAMTARLQWPSGPAPASK
jgi:hypothetical protein